MYFSSDWAFIYNSRNYKGLLDMKEAEKLIEIYNSRNYKGLLDISISRPDTPSTTVEIIRVS